MISGFLAKESVVSTLEVAFASGIDKALNSVSAVSMLIFSLLYTPCVAAVAAMKRELGNKWAIGIVLWQCTVAWIVAFIVKSIIEII